jgi:hypothetical protein
MEDLAHTSLSTLSATIFPDWQDQNALFWLARHGPRTVEDFEVLEVGDKDTNLEVAYLTE